MAATAGPMDASTHAGGCHCGAVRWTFATRQALGQFAPRACDCDFCRRHGAAWVSDAQGLLHVHGDEARLRRYRRGSGQAEFVACAHLSHDGAAVFAICDECGTVTEFEEPRAIAALAAWAKKSKFHTRAMTLELRGRCAACAGR